METHPGDRVMKEESEKADLKLNIAGGGPKMVEE